jgi:hypothetical protein
MRPRSSSWAREPVSYCSKSGLGCCQQQDLATKLQGSREWLDSYFARDVQELFRLEKRAGLLRVLELLLRQSGGMLDVSKLVPCIIHNCG